MSRIVTIAGRSVERSVVLIAMPWAATIGMILLLRWIFDIAPAVYPAPDAADQPLAEGCSRVDRVDQSAPDQTPVVHSRSLLTHADQHRYGPAPAGPGWVSVVGYPQCVAGHASMDPPVPQRRQRRRPSMLAISTALHGGAPR